MRRKDKEIKDKKEIESIIQAATVCRIGLSEDSVPYVVPVNFGYENNCLYFHSATEGKKIDILRRNNKVCFEMDIDHELVKSEKTPCEWGMKYRSVIGFGKAFVVDDFEEKRMTLNIIRQRYSGDSYEFSENQIKKVAIIKIEIDSMTGKKSGY